MKTISQSIRRHLLLHFENQRCNHSSSRLEPEWSGVYCLEGVPGKWGRRQAGAESPSKCPTSLAHRAYSPVQIPFTPHPDPCWEKCLMAKWPQSQTKHSECSQAPQMAGTEGPSLL